MGKKNNAFAVSSHLGIIEEQRILNKKTTRPIIKSIQVPPPVLSPCFLLRQPQRILVTWINK